MKEVEMKRMQMLRTLFMTTIALAAAVVPVSADSLGVGVGIAGVGNTGCLAGNTTAGTGPITLTQACSSGGPDTSTAAASADYGKLGAFLDLTIDFPPAGFTPSNNGSVGANFRAHYIFSGPGPTVTTSLNLDLEGTLNESCASTEDCSIDVGVTIAIQGGGFFTGRVIIDQNGPHFSDGVLDITGVLSTGSVHITTPAFISPTGVPIEIFVELSSEGHLRSNGTGISLGVTSDFSSTLSFPTNGPVFNLPSGFTVNGPNVVNNRFVIIDHFLCYSAKTTKGTPKFGPLNVTLKDQFDEGAFSVKKPVSLCNPADKNNEGINDPNTHLKGYQILPETVHVRVTGIIVKNQFHPGGLSFDTIKPDRLLVPTAKCIDDPPGSCPPTLPVPDSEVDHYKCYTVHVTRRTPQFPKGIQATVVDQFNQPKLYDIKKPTRLCTPVLDKEHPPGTHTLAKNPDVHLMCYQAKPASAQPKHVKVLGIHVNNQFGAEQLDTINEDELCVPSTKTR
jgi:hypothetical protein